MTTRLILLTLALVVNPGLLAAQTVIDLGKAQFQWDWAQGTGGAITEFRIKCGPNEGTYPIIVLVGATLRAFPVNQVITGSGAYHCVISAANQFGESFPSNDVFFAAGVTPSSPSNLRVTP